MDTPTTPTAADAETSLELAQQLACVNLAYIQERIGERMLDPTTTTKALLDMGEHSYKVSGMAKKAESKEDQGRFVFNINFSGGTSPVRIEKVIDGDAETVPQLVSEATLALSLEEPDYSELV